MHAIDIYGSCQNMTSCELATYDIYGTLVGIYVRLLGVRSRGEEIDPGDIVNSDIAVERESCLDCIFATHESS